MKHLLILFLLVSFSANATAALFDSNDQNSSKVKSSTNYSSNSASVKKNSALKEEIRELRALVKQRKNTKSRNEAKELRAEINELKRSIKKQKEEEKIKRENEALNEELKEIKKMLNEKDSVNDGYSNNNTPNITIINSPTNNNTNTNTNSGGGFSSLFNSSKSKEIRRHILSVGISDVDSFITGDNFLSGHENYYTNNVESAQAPTISYSYRGDTFYFGAYYSQLDQTTKYDNIYSRWSSCCNKKYTNIGYVNNITINNDELFGAKIGLNLYKNNFINLLPYFSLNKVIGSVDIETYGNPQWWWVTQYQDFELEKTFTTVGLDALIDLNDSIAIKLGVGKVIDKSSSFDIQGTEFSSENTGTHADSNKILTYAGLAIKF
ncbi:hypothetical protein N9C35_05125 [Flavobacteriaceae bacterium]|nr:hypothetical protein [Flavobacteriaceae bacterium]